MFATLLSFCLLAVVFAKPHSISPRRFGTIIWDFGLDDNGKEFVEFQVQAKTLGWAAIGIADEPVPASGMQNADIILFGVRDGKAYLQDSYGPSFGNGHPLRDELQNIVVMGALQNETHTVVQFRRLVDTKDKEQDKKFGNSLTLLYALHSSDAKPNAKDEERGRRHSVRGMVSVKNTGLNAFRLQNQLL